MYYVGIYVNFEMSKNVAAFSKLSICYTLVIFPVTCRKFHFLWRNESDVSQRVAENTVAYYASMFWCITIQKSQNFLI